MNLNEIGTCCKLLARVRLVQTGLSAKSLAG
ncbi:hypothetical protein F0726_01776 [Acidithiobacillus caldus]|nr:hypothetical protein F0726_01776 [Acidithiobacillus caldus]